VQIFLHITTISTEILFYINALRWFSDALFLPVVHQLCMYVCMYVSLMLCIPVIYQQHQHPKINLFCLLSLLNEIQNNFLGNDSKMVFTLQKKLVRITVGAKPQTPCRDLFKKLQILPLPCEYIFSWLNSVINNLGHFQTNSAIHCVNTRNKHHLHRPIANLICFQKST
jgi:hypothetical protein